jgi:hypothetical protein
MLRRALAPSQSFQEHDSVHYDLNSKACDHTRVGQEDGYETPLKVSSSFLGHDFIY